MSAKKEIDAAVLEVAKAAQDAARRLYPDASQESVEAMARVIMRRGELVLRRGGES